MWNYKQEIYDWVTKSALKKNIVVVTGPTASGKTGVSIEIAEFFQENGIGAEIINADSRQIYRDLPITVAVPTFAERKNIPHHLFEYVSPAKTYNVAEWKNDALQKIKEIHERGNVVIFCGGTGLWIDAVTKNYTLGVAPNEKFREECEKKTIEELYEALLEKDAKQAGILGKNKKYLIRALEICEELGNKTDYAVESEPEYNFFMLGITWEREKLYSRINARNEIMFSDGFLKEADDFTKKYITNLPDKNTQKGYKAHINTTDINKNDCGFIAHGIPEYLQFRNDEITLEELKDKMKQHTRNYAKRQLTWWRKDKRVRFLNRETEEEVNISAHVDTEKSSRKNTKFKY